MRPDDSFNPFNPQPSGIDYLNQIAPPAPPQKFDKKTKIIIIILGIIGIISLSLIFMLAQNSQSRTSATPLKVAARVHKLLSVSQKYNNKMQTSAMQTINSSLVSVLTTANSSIAEPLQASGIDPKKQKKEIEALDPTTRLEKKFDEAVLNAQLDVMYAHEMNVELTDTITMLKRLQKSTRSKSMKEYLAKTITDLQNIQKQLNEFLKTN